MDAERVGRAVAYRLNREHLAAGPIVEIARLQATFIQFVRDIIEGWSVEARLRRARSAPRRVGR